LNYIRLTSNGLKVPKEVWRNKEGKEVTLLGAMHVADEQYFDVIRDALTIAIDDGAHLHLEQIKSIEDKSGLSDHERLFLQHMKYQKEDRKVMAEAAGLVDQGTCLKDIYDTHESEDVSILELFDENKVIAYHKSVQEHLAGTDAMSSLRDLMKASPSIARKVVRTFVFFMPFIHRFAKYMPSDLTMDMEVILNRRNEFAMNALLSDTGDKHVLFWGSAHLPGMGEILKAHGYKRVSRSWNLAVARKSKKR
jgi:hypothetical protein